ncbi:MAG: sulfurtransferase [Deltaproteobacteria bacterium]|nr:MAG: sulfurtransferase [Deltaproteobacteria bacterium]
MSSPRSSRFVVIAIILLIGTFWAFSSATGKANGGYPADILIDGTWLKAHKDDPGTVVVDVRQDKYLDGRFIPGAVRLPYSEFQVDDNANGVGSVFVGASIAQEILGKAGISREDTVILYDSVKRDGGATSSYFFWVLDYLGHKKVKVLNRGIDGWVDAGNEIVDAPATAEPVLYQAPADEINTSILTTGEFIRSRLGDTHYLIMDVRSPEEYIGEKANGMFGGGPLKLGHIPTSINIEYKSAWVDNESKAIKDYAGLLETYRGLDPTKTIILYCHSGRRASFTYLILRLMGLEDVKVYEASYYEWGRPDKYFPVELEVNKLSGVDLPTNLKKAQGGVKKTGEKGGPAKGGYVSCGG